MTASQDGLNAAGNNQCIKLNVRIRELESIANNPSVAEDVRRRARYYANDLRSGGCPRNLGTMVPYMMLPQDYDIPASTQTPSRRSAERTAAGRCIVLPKRTFLGTEVGGIARRDLLQPRSRGDRRQRWGSVKFDLGAASFFAPFNVFSQVRRLLRRIQGRPKPASRSIPAQE